MSAAEKSTIEFNPRVQVIRPGPFIASLVPGKEFHPDRHIDFGDVFVEKIMSSFVTRKELVSRNHRFRFPFSEAPPDTGPGLTKTILRVFSLRPP